MLPNLAVYHPQIVHFVIALLVAGVAFRLISFAGSRLSWASPAATSLIVAGTVAAFLAVKSGTDAHAPVERIPGAREAVQEHEDWGERTRNLFIVVSLLEIAALVLTRHVERRQVVRGLRVGSLVVGAVGIGFIYETGEHGGDIVYEHAGGVGTHSGSPQDVQNLLVAGLYNSAIEQRKAGNLAEAGRLTDELLRLRPADPAVKMLAIQSLLQDKNDPRGALDALAQMPLAASGPMRTQVPMMRARAYMKLGQKDSARAEMTPLKDQIATNPRLKAFADSLQ
jgi:uncharacterized membrane protein